MENQAVMPLVKEILAARGFVGERAMREFVHSSVSSLSEPFAIPSMLRGCEILRDAVARRDRIHIYGDGDVDGICAVYFMARLLEVAGADFSFHLTHRLDEDYEIEEEQIDQLAEEGCSLLVAVDCGTSSLDALRKAEKLSIRCVVLDHHPCMSDSLPVNHVYVNPHLAPWDESTRNLTGAGIAYKFLQGMELLLPNLREKHLSQAMELACLAALGDMAPLTGENRIFVRESISKNKFMFTGIRGLKKFLGHLGIEGNPTLRDIRMKVNPRLNSPGRLGKPEVALNLLMATDDDEIYRTIDEMESMDRQRYREGAKIMKTLDNSIAGMEDGFIVSERFSPGFCGLIASRLSSKHERPFLVGYLNGDTVRGSVRSPAGYNLVKDMCELSPLMLSLGGHRGAMGFKCRTRDIDEIKESWKSIRWQKDAPGRGYDCELDIGQLTPELLSRLTGELEPFGEGNPAPVFLCRDVTAKKMTKAGGEKQFWARKGEALFECLMEPGAPAAPADGEKIGIIYTPRLSSRNGLYRISLRIKDYLPQQANPSRQAPAVRGEKGAH